MKNAAMGRKHIRLASVALFFGLSCLLCASGCQREGPTPVADLVLVGGKVVTVDPALPEAEAVAVRADTILAVGTNALIETFVGPDTQVLDMKGRLVVPGFIEGHGHFMDIGLGKTELDLKSVTSWKEMVDLVADAASQADPGEWIEGRGWHQEKWTSVPIGSVEGVPTHHSLTEVSPENPVFLRHTSGHASFVNAEAMRRAGISPETPDPPGGEIIRDARGEPTGYLIETAERLVSQARLAARVHMTVEEIDAERRLYAKLASEEVLSKGITSFHDAGVSTMKADLYRQLAEEGELPVRLYVMLQLGQIRPDPPIQDYYTVGYGQNHLTIRSIKQSLDGALGPRGAWLLEPYADLPGSHGLNTLPIDSLELGTRFALEHGFQLNVHAIGDRANRETLDRFERAFASRPDARDLRWRIEHAQHLHPDDIPRFGQLDVIASMQGIHCTSDAPWVFVRLGETRAEEGAYVWQKLWQTGAVVTNGTDAPVEDVDPIASFYATVSRKLPDGSVFFPDQRLSREQALQTYTMNNAFAAFEEDIKGSITVGKLADFTVLSKDIMTIDEDDIPDTEVVYTIVGGKVLYERSAGQ